MLPSYLYIHYGFVSNVKCVLGNGALLLNLPTEHIAKFCFVNMCKET